MGGLAGTVVVHAVLTSFLVTWVHAQEPTPPPADTSGQVPQMYDPFGPENAPDHTGQGSGGVLTPGPYDNLIQTLFTRTNSDYYGVQYMFDSPVQASIGGSFSAYQTHGYGIVGKVRYSGFRALKPDPLRREEVPYYFLSSEVSFEAPFGEKVPRGYKLRVHTMTEAKGLSMAGVGVIVARGNLLLAADRAMDRRLEAEMTWVQVAGGYIMPLSPRKGGVNLTLCGGVDLLGLKYQSYYSTVGDFIGVKLGSIGWVFGVGWNVSQVANLSAYVGTEWGFSFGGLDLPGNRIVPADIGRSTMYLGLQATGRWFNIVGGIQKERENLDFQSFINSDRALRYYLGANIYVRR